MWPATPLSIESKEPDSINVTVVRRVSKTVPVEVVWTGTPAEGFMIDKENRTLDYSEVTVTGPESVVDTIAKATITVDLEGRQGVPQRELPLYAL